MEHTLKKRKTSDVESFIMITGVVKGTLVLTPQPPDLGGLKTLPIPEIGQNEQSPLPPEVGGTEGGRKTLQNFKIW